MKNEKVKTNSQITNLMKEAYAAELETEKNHLANSVWLDGLGAQEVAESLAEDVTEELGHATKLAHRLKHRGWHERARHAAQFAARRFRLVGGGVLFGERNGRRMFRGKIHPLGIRAPPDVSFWRADARGRHPAVAKR